MLPHQQQKVGKYHQEHIFAALFYKQLIGALKHLLQLQNPNHQEGLRSCRVWPLNVMTCTCENQMATDQLFKDLTYDKLYHIYCLLHKHVTLYKRLTVNIDINFILSSTYRRKNEYLYEWLETLFLYFIKFLQLNLIDQHLWMPSTFNMLPNFNMV